MADGVTMSDVYYDYRVKYEALKAEAAQRRADAAAVQAQLDDVNAQIEELRFQQAALVEQKSVLLGGQSYIDLKKHISALAKLLSGK